MPPDKAPSFIGVLLAIIGSSLIGLSYTASKDAHNNVHAERQRVNSATKARSNGSSESGHDATSCSSTDIHASGDESVSINFSAVEEAPLLGTLSSAADVQSYSLRDAMKRREWWVSMVLLIAGEACNFMAYGFAPTSVIAPLGTLSIISGALSGYFYLGERIMPGNIVGMAVSVLGSVIIVLFSRAEEPQLSPEAIIEALCQLQFLVYTACVVSIAVFLLVLDNTKIKGSEKTHGDSTMIVRVLLTAIFSGFTALATKSVSSLLGLSFYLIFTYWIFYGLLVVLVGNALLTLYFTNKALATFDSTRVLPAEFAAFTVNVVIGSSVLYNDFVNATPLQIGMFVIGCFVTFAGVYFITSDGVKYGQSSKSSSRHSTVLLAGGFLPIPFPPAPARPGRPRSRTARSDEPRPYLVNNARFSTWRHLLSRLESDDAHAKHDPLIVNADSLMDDGNERLLNQVS